MAIVIAYCIAPGFVESATDESGARSPIEVPRLCWPVNYREPLVRITPRTFVSMLEDRYLEVGEALDAWNETGVPLVGIHNGRWEPVPCGDDTGLFYLVPLLARRAKLTADQALNFFFFAVIAASAVFGAAGVWTTVSGFRQRSLGVVTVSLGSLLALKAGDVYLAQVCVVLMLLPWMIYASRNSLSQKRRLGICFACGIMLGLAQWIRSSAAWPMLVFFVLLVYLRPPARVFRTVISATLTVGFLLPLLYARIPLQQREQFLSQRQPNISLPAERHLFWHTAYLGLSFITNRYVPAFLDADAVAYVGSVNPTAVYGDPGYEEILRKRVEQIARQDYLFIIYTLAAKAGVLLLFLLLCTNVGLVAAYCRPKPAGEEVAYWTAMALAGLPGMIALPISKYVGGMIMLALYYCFYSVAHYWKQPTPEQPA